MTFSDNAVEILLVEDNPRDAELTIRISRDLIENAKRFAAENKTTLTKLIEAYLTSLLSLPSLEDAPIVRRLSGALSQDGSIQDYKDHLEEKYGR